MAGLTNPKTLAEVQKLSDMCFQGNSILDTIVYAMNTYLNTPKLYEFCHFTLSHSLPTIFSDAITEFMMQRNDRVYRGALTESNKTYNNIIECLEDILLIFEGINKQLNICIDSAIETDDKPVEDFLRGFYVDIATPFYKQALVLRNGAKNYNEDGILAQFNKEFESFIVLPEKFILN